MRRSPSLLLMGWLSLVSVTLAQTGVPRTTRSRSAAGNPIGHTGAYNEPAATFHGTLKRLTKKQIVIVSNQDQTVEIQRTHKTKFLKDGKAINPEEIAIGTQLTLDVGKDPDLNPQAINVVVSSAAIPPAATKQN